MSLAAYRGATSLAGPLVRRWLARRARRGKEDPARIAERFGNASVARPEGRLIWLHAASVGEAVSAMPLIGALREAGTCLLTTGTVTAARRAGELLPEGCIHQYVPVDTGEAVGRFLDHWRPDLAVWIESEIWPRLVSDTAARGVPMALVNARLSQRSFRGWRQVPAMARDLFGAFRLIVAQDRATVERLAALGAGAEEGANLKALVPPPACDEAELAGLRATLGSRPRWLAASTHPGEEEIAADASPEGALLILAPRHPERGDAVAEMLARRGLGVTRRSRGEAPGGDIHLADTLGEMGLWYRLAPVAFVGGSLVEMGGHTPFEPAALGAAILHGPHLANFAPAYAALAAAGGAREVRDAADLRAAVAALLEDGDARARMAGAAAGVRDAAAGDLAPLARRLLALIP